MTLPSDLYSVTVTGSFRDAAGQALAGTVYFTPSTTLTDSTGNVVIPAYTKPYPLTGGALATAPLVATDCADIEPTGWTYLVTVALQNLQQYSYNVLIPAAPFAFTATNATPCVFTATGSAYADGAPVLLTGASVPAGFTAGTTYYVVSASGTSFSLAATSGGSAIASTSTGSGFVSTASVDISNLQPVTPSGTPAAYVPTSGGTYTGTVVFDGSPALQIPSGAAAGKALTSDSAGNAAWASPAGLLTPTAVKTANYTAAAGDLVKTDTSGGSFTVTLPTAPAVNTTIGVKQVTVAGAGTNATTIAAGGSDVFNKSGGPASMTLDRQNQTVTLQYGSGGVWTVTSTDPAVGQIATARQGVYYLDTYTGTDDQKMTAALSALFAAGGGTIVLSPRAHTFAGQWSTSYSAGVVTALKIQGAGIGWDGTLGGTPSAATTCTMSYASAGAARMDFQHVGTIELTGILFKDSGASSVPFFQTTNAKPSIHDCGFMGSATGASCFQDAIVLGGGGTSIGAGDTAKFNGYQAVIRDNFFAGIRRAVFGQHGCNGTSVHDNTISNTCGSNLYLTGPFDFHDATAGVISGLTIRSNIVEVGGYQTGVSLRSCTSATVGPNGFWDGGSDFMACYYIDPACGNTLVIDGFAWTGSQLVFDQTVGATTTVITSSASQPNFEGGASRKVYDETMTFGLKASPRLMDYQGDFIEFQAAQNTASTTPTANLLGAVAKTVSDGSTVSGSPIVTSATAAWTNSANAAYPISGTGIPNESWIQQVYTASVAPRWFASSAYNAGDVVKPPTANSHLYQCTVAGTTDSAAVTWPTGGGTVTDGGVTWQDLGTGVTAASMSRVATATATGVTLYYGPANATVNIASWKAFHMASLRSAPTVAAGAAVGAGPP